MLARFNKMRNEEGFTLIELLIVIIVLGILVAIVLFGLGTFKGDSQAAACKADRKQLQTAGTAYVAKFPGTALAAATGAATLSNLSYIQAVPASSTDGVALTVGIDTSGNVTVTDCP